MHLTSSRAVGPGIEADPPRCFSRLCVVAVLLYRDPEHHGILALAIDNKNGSKAIFISIGVADAADVHVFGGVVFCKVNLVDPELFKGAYPDSSITILEVITHIFTP